MPQTLGRRIKTLRQQHGWTQTQLAAESGLIQSQISEIERGRSPDPKISVVRQLARAFGMTLDGFMEDVSDPAMWAADTGVALAAAPVPAL